MPHTPGPWEIAPLIRSGGLEAFLITNTLGRLPKLGSTTLRKDREETLSNVRLILAAPDLLDALEEILDRFTEAHDAETKAGHFGDNEEGYQCSYCQSIQKAKDAIRKAKEVVKVYD